MREAELLQQRSDIAFVMSRIAKTRGDDALEIDTPPSHAAINFPIGTRFDDFGELGFLGDREPRRRSARPGVAQAVRTALLNR